MASISLHGTPCNTSGDLPAVGTAAPDFLLVTADLANVGLDNYAGKKKLLNIVPSLDTGTCAISTSRFNQEIGTRDDVVALVVSADLPFAQKRFCDAEGIENVDTLSMMRGRKFAKDYGILIADGPLAGICGRAVVVLNEDNQVIYTQLVGEIADEPDYASALTSLS